MKIKNKSNYNPIYSFIFFIIAWIIFTIVWIKLLNTNTHDFNNKEDKYTWIFFMFLFWMSWILWWTKLIIKYVKENKRILKLKKIGEVKKAKINNIIKSSHWFFIYASNKQAQYSQEIFIKTDKNIKIWDFVNVYEDPENHYNYRIDINWNP